MWRKVISLFHIFFKSLSVLQLQFESGEDEEQVYGDWDQCSRKLWDSRDLAWQLQYAPLFSTPCQALAESIYSGDAMCPDGHCHNIN